MRVHRIRIGVVVIAAFLAGGCGRDPLGGKSARGPVEFKAPPSEPLGVGEEPPLGPAYPALVCTPTIDMKVLVISANGAEADLPAIKQALRFLGTPFRVWVATQNAGQLTPDKLSNDAACRAYYQGVILTTSELLVRRNGRQVSALTSAEWQALAAFEAGYRIRQVTWYTRPTSAYGFYAPTRSFNTANSPLDVRATAEGTAVFSYLNASEPLTIRDAYAYLAKPLDSNTVPLLVDAAGNALAAIRNFSDGRQNLALTFDSNQWVTHTLALSYGLIHWVTRGLFLGERHVYLSPQVDDFFIDDDSYFGGVFRLSAADLTAFLAWQRARQASPLTSQLRVSLAFNGSGTTDYARDTLTPAALANQADFYWINHSYSHENLDGVSYSLAYREVTQNASVATRLGFTRYSPLNMVTPDISGLTTRSAMQALFDAGIRFVVTDSSQPGYDNPSPNAGIYNPLQPGILMIPRRPTNLFYNVSRPAEWVAEYNEIYSGYWGRDLTYAEILDEESDVQLSYLLKGEMDPLMYHQPNMRAYDGTRSLLGELTDRTLAKYARIYRLPVLFPSMDALGARMAARMQYDRAGVAGSFVPGGAITVTSTAATTVPITGVCSTQAERYGDQCIHWVPVNGTASVPLR